MNILEEQHEIIQKHFENISKEELDKNLEKCGINDIKLDFKSEILDLYPVNPPIGIDIHSFTQHVMTKIINMEDNLIKDTMIDYAKEYANEKLEPVRLFLLDENQVKTIINLGIDEYIKRKEKLSNE